MITGKSYCSGTYHYRRVTCGNRDVTISNTPEDSWNIRIAFRHHDETSIPVLKLDMQDAELLWAALNAMSVDLKWNDKMPDELDSKGESGK